MRYDPSMAPVSLPASLASTAATSTDVYCSQCSQELESWEVHLLKHLNCPHCGATLELGATMRIELPLD